ncbi:MAG: peptidoglycan DD-metalloendopeptidase family protein [Rhodobiaceae bacterium]
MSDSTFDSENPQAQQPLYPPQPAPAPPPGPSRLARRRKRARRRFTLAFASMALLLVWMLDGFMDTRLGEPALSAKPAPRAAAQNDILLKLPPMQRRFETRSLRENDTLAGLLARQNIDPVTADAALDTLRSVYDPRRLQPGQEIRLYREWPADIELAQVENFSTGRFAGFDFIPVARQRIIIRRTGDDRFHAIKQDRPLTDRYFLADSLVTSSVYEAGRDSGMAPKLVVELIRLFSFAIDFQRDIREGDQLEVLYTRRFDEANELAEEGEILYAALTNRGNRYTYWRLEHEDGSAAFYDETGKSVQRLLMKTPVDGARLSSRFGMRRHPILGYTRLHRGLDFAAPRGTPIFAAGDGKIVERGKNAELGNYMAISHRNGYRTVYAHMRRFAGNTRRGSTVRQGQTIGYVGATGLATGPHLHYEVWHNKKPVNPRAIELPRSRILNSAELQTLSATREATSARMADMAAQYNVLQSLPPTTRNQ